MSPAPAKSHTRPAFLVAVLGLLSLFAWAGIAIAAERCEVGSQDCMPAATHAALHGDVHLDIEACATQIIASPHAIAAPVSNATPTVGAHVRGYKEEGTTTTPFDMAVRNDIDRFHLVKDVVDRVPSLGRELLISFRSLETS